MTNVGNEKFRERKCKVCASTECFHRSRFKASGRHYPKKGSQKRRESK